MICQKKMSEDMSERMSEQTFSERMSEENVGRYAVSQLDHSGHCWRRDEEERIILMKSKVSLWDKYVLIGCHGGDHSK